MTTWEEQFAEFRTWLNAQELPSNAVDKVYFEMAGWDNAGDSPVEDMAIVAKSTVQSILDLGASDYPHYFKD